MFLKSNKMATPMKVPRLTVGRPKKSESAKKRRKLATQTSINKSRIFIGDQIERWNVVKAEIRAKTNAEVAKVLIDKFYEPSSTTEEVSPKLKFPLKRKQRPVKSSTPFQKFLVQEQQQESSAESPISGVEPVASSSQTVFFSSTPASLHKLPLLKQQQESSAESSISGVEPFASTSHASSSESPKKGSQLQKVIPGYSASFVDPLELSIDVFEDSSSEIENEDEDYEPSFDISLGPANQNIVEASFAEDFFVQEEEGEVADTDESGAEGVVRILTSKEAAELSKDQMFLCSRDALLTLSHMSIDDICQKCNKPLSFSEKKIGSAVYFKWVCEDGHDRYTWCSQPLLRGGVHSGDLLISAAVLFSGNNFQKIALFANFFNLAMVSSSSFNRFQTMYLVPAVEKYWNSHVEEILQSKRGKDIVILGDGRMDSPGHCAQYCTYTAMDNETKEIVSVVTIDKRETGKSSIRMEKEAFIRTLTHFENRNVNVAEVVTDAHTSIAAHLRKECPHIRHSFDVWHVAKNLAKRIMKAGQQKECGSLKGWCRHIVNHFYHACDKARDVEEFAGIWFGLLHHVVNEHEWSLGCGSNITRCVHGPLMEPREVEWLSKGSPAHDALRLIVADKKFLQQIPYFLNARSTAELEGFNNLILMYAGKRFSYVPPVYKARNLVAAIDHNSHLFRPSVTNKDGTERVHKIFNKKSSRWLIRPVKEKKSYGYRDALMEIVLKMRTEEKKSLFQQVTLKKDDPRRLSATIAQVPPPSTEQLRLEQVSRFKKTSE